jgi:hypothetical protein
MFVMVNSFNLANPPHRHALKKGFGQGLLFPCTRIKFMPTQEGEVW